VKFTNKNGNPAEGEMWSPGPAPRSVWVLLADGATAAVHMDKKREIGVPEDPRGSCRCGPGCTDRYCTDRARLEYIDKFRSGPKPIRAGEWARVVELFRVEGAGS
jgi:hypothetical protein